jgi:hypothetical protein
LAADGRWYAPELHPSVTGGASGAAHRPVAVQVPDLDDVRQKALAGLPLFDPIGPVDRADVPPSVWGPAPAPTPGYGPPPPGSFGPPTYPPHPNPTSGPPHEWPYGPDAGSTTNGLAIASLVLSIVTVVGIGSILGIIFGFVARGQIARSRGRQKGAGLALSGIIIGFATLSLILLAVAIPTFIGVQRTTDGTEHLPASVIRLGTPIEGGPAGPITWTPMSLPGDTTVGPVSGGVTMDIATSHEADYASVPLWVRPGPTMPLSADVEIIQGATSNGIGLGCSSPDRTQQVAFFIHRSGQWDVELFLDHSTVLIDAGTTSVIDATGPNQLAVDCAPAVGVPGSTDLAMEINGTPVVHDVARFVAASWLPTIQMCSCDGPAVGAFTDVTYYSGTTSTTT